MIANYRLLQFVPKAENPEPITVGVLLWSERAGHIRLLGDDLGNRPGEIYSRLAGPTHDFSNAIAREWFEWFQNLVLFGIPPGKIQIASMDRLSTTGSPFIARYGGHVEANITSDSPKNAEHLLCDELFGEVVLDKPEIRTLLLRERLIRACESADRADIDRVIIDAEIEIPGRGKQPRALLYFPAVVKRATTVLFQTITFNATADHISEEVSRTLATFDVAVRRKVTTRDGCVAVIDPSESMAPHYLKCLNSAATVLDINDPQLNSRIHALLPP